MVTKKQKEIETCCVADQYCKSPANLEPPQYISTRCFCCGQAVCTNCSIVTQYFMYGKQRICHNCVEQFKGGDKIVLAHLEKLGGQ